MAIYCNLADVREELDKAPGASDVDDQAINNRIPRAADVINEFCRHSFDDEAITAERRNGEAVLRDADGLIQITASKANVQTLTAARITADMQTWHTLDITRCDIDRYVLTFYGATAPVGRSARLVAELTYRGGYANIPELVRYCASRTVAFMFMARRAPFEATAFPAAGQVIIPAKLPPDVSSALGTSTYMRRRP